VHTNLLFHPQITTSLVLGTHLYVFISYQTTESFHQFSEIVSQFNDTSSIVAGKGLDRLVGCNSRAFKLIPLIWKIAVCFPQFTDDFIDKKQQSLTREKLMEEISITLQTS